MEWTNLIFKSQGLIMKKLFYVTIVLSMITFISCSKESKENAACVAQCLLSEERGQDFANNNNEELSVQNEKLNRILKDMEEQKILLDSLRAEIVATNKLQDSATSDSDSVTQDALAENPSTYSETQAAEPTSESGPILVAEENYEDKIPENREKKSDFKEQAISGTIGAVFGAAGGFMAAQKMSCKRLDILIEYKLMQVCVSSCGYNTEEKCGAAIMNMLCKEKLEEDEVKQRASSCDIRR